MKAMLGGLAAVLGLALLATACTESGAGGREVHITQTADGCTPASIAVTPGEKLQFVVKNDSNDDVYELEGIDGTKLEEFVVPGGKTRKAGYTVPDAATGTYKIKCYVPTGPSTIIELIAGGGTTPASGGGTEAPAPGGMAGPASDTVAVGLTEYVVTPGKADVKAGKIKFVATNTSASMTHELAVLKKKDDGTFENAGEIEDIAPGNGGEIILDLAPGSYELACLIVPGEAGSTVDHYKSGMHTMFTVE
jgi:uncharacterized cupredoxin-like copper-binding protein